MEDAMAWVRTAGCASLVGVGTAAGSVPWWVAVLALTVGCGPQVRATAETISNIAWRWKHPDCGCHSGFDHRPGPAYVPGTADPPSGHDAGGDGKSSPPPASPLPSAEPAPEGCDLPQCRARSRRRS